MGHSFFQFKKLRTKHKLSIISAISGDQHPVIQHSNSTEAPFRFHTKFLQKIIFHWASIKIFTQFSDFCDNM